MNAKLHSVQFIHRILNKARGQSFQNNIHFNGVSICLKGKEVVNEDENHEDFGEHVGRHYCIYT